MASVVTLSSRFEQEFAPPALRSYLAEFISTFLYVFLGVGSAMASGYPASENPWSSTGLVAIAVAHAFALCVAVYVASNISGGHVNPAVTFGLAVGGHITILTGIFYWISQMIASTLACLLLRLLTAGQPIPTHGVASEMTGFGASVMESIFTFAVVYTVYATRDATKGSLGIIGPIAIGFVTGASILAAGPFTGGSTNPARSFGPAIISGEFKNHGVYWVGPLIGAGLAGLVYENVMFPSTAHVMQGV